MALRLLDLFCGAGGACKGYQRAGFYVVGVDIRPQPHYCGEEFYQADALDYAREHGHEFDVIHSSPPCQAWSRATDWTGDRKMHPKLISSTRDALKMIGRPYIIENVQEARHDLINPIMLCGSHFGVPTQSHRYFETYPFILAPTVRCRHHPRTDVSRDHGAKQPESVFRDLIGCKWMTVHEARQAIPPAYTEWIGRQLMAILTKDRK